MKAMVVQEILQEKEEDQVGSNNLVDIEVTISNTHLSIVLGNLGEISTRIASELEEDKGSPII
jgi:hypothetical protein